jgi:hypothetical protein
MPHKIKNAKNESPFSAAKPLSKINYKEYPEYMFAIVAAYLPEWQGHDLRRVAGSVIFKHVDNKGNTYKNGTLHSYNDMPAVIDGDYQTWYKNGKIHRDGDNPAIICNYTKIKHGFIDTYRGWYKNGLRHRQGDLPAVIYKNKQEWWKNGKIHRDGDKPAVINVNYEAWWKHGEVHRDGDLPAIIDHNYRCWYKSGVRVASNYGRIGVYIEIEPIINEPSLIKLFFNGINMVTYLLLLMINIVKW